MILPTASAFERAQACPGSCYLPQSGYEHPSGVRGTAIHAFLETMGRGEPLEAALKAAGDWARYCALLDLSRLPVGGAWRPEVPLYYHVEARTGRVGQHMRRYYDPRPGELYGTTDVIGLGADYACVVDYKSGKHVTPLARNLQVRFAALAAARAYGRQTIHAMLVFLHDDGSHFTESATWDVFELAIIEQEMTVLWDRIHGPRAAGQRNEGEHCRYCPAFAACPSKISLALAITNPQIQERMEARLLTPENAAEVYHKLIAAEQVLARIRGAIYGFARQQAIDLGNGKLLGERVTQRRAVKGEAAWDALSSLHGPEVARRAVTIEASLTSVREALAPLRAKGRSIAQMEREALAKIEELQGLSTKTIRTVTEYTPKEEDHG